MPELRISDVEPAQRHRLLAPDMEDNRAELRHMAGLSYPVLATAALDEDLRRMGMTIMATPFSPSVDKTISEFWIGSFRRECLNHFLSCRFGHPDHVAQTYARICE